MTIQKEIETQLSAIKAFDSEALFDILIAKYHEAYKGLGDYVERKVLYQEQDSPDILDKIESLKQLNEEGWNIYIRTNQFYKNSFFVVDDVSNSHIYQINQSMNTYWSLEEYNPQFKLVDIIETSNKNYQVWLYNESPFKLIDKNKMSKKLAELFSADLACADIGKFSRLVGFRNTKPIHTFEDNIEMVAREENFYQQFKDKEQNNNTVNVPTNIIAQEDSFDELEQLLNQPTQTKKLKF
jgi:hypothetical protein